MDSSIAHVARLILFFAAAAASVSARAHCSNPSVRREWRSLSAHERAEWIEAVNVRSSPFIFVLLEAQPHFQCLSSQPHDSNLVATQPPVVSLIPPINPDSSYYDGSSTPILDFTMLTTPTPQT